MGLNSEIQKMIIERTLRDVICQNTATISELPNNVFRMEENLVNCEDFVDLDFELIAKIISNGHESVTKFTDEKYETTTKENAKDIYI